MGAFFFIGKLPRTKVLWLKLVTKYISKYFLWGLAKFCQIFLHQAILNYGPSTLQESYMPPAIRIRVSSVSDPDKGVCADPADEDAILGRGEPDPYSGNRERQLAPDKGRGKTWYIVRWEDDEWTRKTTPSQLQNASMHRVRWCA